LDEDVAVAMVRQEYVAGFAGVIGTVGEKRFKRFKRYYGKLLLRNCT
jgi:hypothetical protein